MDYPLGDKKLQLIKLIIYVLIPILMDYPLGDGVNQLAGIQYVSLNPYSNGLPSRGFFLFRDPNWKGVMS